MRTALTDRRLRAERKLFDVHARLERARSELEILEEQLAALAEDAEETRLRALVSETAAANIEFREARRHAEVMERRRDAAKALIAELLSTQDELLAKLVG